jgi:GNAT superfamily N-acetyltransferase|tara:strand:+ start:122 stop:613 length:492 start_codon:yes stop_codon:yes gene_type:complete
MIVRRIKSSEGDLIKELRIAAITDSALAFGESLAEAEKRTKKEYESSAKLRAQSNTDAFFVAEDCNDCIGIIGAFFENDTNKPFISSMWVQPSKRKLKVGAKLFLTAKEWLFERGATKIHAWVAQDNIGAINFYKKLGFIASKETDAMPNNSTRLDTVFIYEI